MLADRQQNGRLHVRRVGARALFGPDLASLPERPAAVHQLAVVDPVAGAPLLLEVDQAGVGDDALEARGGRFQPVGEMSAVACAAGGLARAVDEGETLDRFVRRFSELIARTLERVAFDVLRELLAVAGRARVIGEQQDVAGLGQQVIVPAQGNLIAPLPGRPAVDEDEQRILVRLHEGRRLDDHVVDLPAALAREPEVLGRQPVDALGVADVEVRQVGELLPDGIDAHDLGGIDRAAPLRDEQGRGGLLRDAQVGEDATLRRERQLHLAAAGRHRVNLLQARLLGREVDGRAVGVDGPRADGAIKRHVGHHLAVGQLVGQARPVEADEARVVVLLLVQRLPGHEERLSVW